MFYIVSIYHVVIIWWYRAWLQAKAVNQKTNKQKEMHFDQYFEKVNSEVTTQ